jgi:hypothetical protein
VSALPALPFVAESRTDPSGQVVLGERLLDEEDPPVQHTVVGGKLRFVLRFVQYLAHLAPQVDEGERFGDEVCSGIEGSVLVDGVVGVPGHV